MAPILHRLGIFGQPFILSVDKNALFNILLVYQKKPNGIGRKMSIKEYLKKHRLTLQEFAYESHIGTSTIYRLLQGTKVSTSTARKIDEFTKGEIPYNSIVKD